MNDDLQCVLQHIVYPLAPLYGNDTAPGKVILPANVKEILRGGEPVFSTDDLYHSNLADEILSIKTYYEQQWLDRGLNIKYIKFVCEERERLVEPDVEIALDPYRSFNRSKRSALASGK